MNSGESCPKNDVIGDILHVSWCGVHDIKIIS